MSTPYHVAVTVTPIDRPPTLLDHARALLLPRDVDLLRETPPHTARVPALLDLVCDAVESSTGTGHRSSRGTSRSPIGLSAADLLGEVEDVVGRGPRSWLVRRVWRWVHAHTADPDAVDTLAVWVARAREVVEPPRPMRLAAPCPACRVAVVHVEDGGERVRRPALEVDRSTGWARCLACPARWSPAHLVHLAAVLDQQRQDTCSNPACEAPSGHPGPCPPPGCDVPIEGGRLDTVGDGHRSSGARGVTCASG